MKKILSLIILFLIIIAGAVSVSADDFLTEGYFAYTVTGNTATICDFASDAAEEEYKAICGGILTIPEKIGGYPVTEIGLMAFRYVRFITEVKLPASVTTIGQDAFLECYGLEKINLENVKFIGISSFADCRQLKNVSLASAKVIEPGAFSYSGLTEVVLPDDIEVIDGFGGSKIREIVIPEGKTVGESAFSECEELEKILIGDNCTLVFRAFSDTPGVKTVDIGKNCVIGDSVFQGSGAETIVIGDGAVISEYAFASCDVKNIDLGNPVSLGKGTFHACTNLKEITVPGSIEVIPEDCFEYCYNLEKVIVCEGVKRIERFAFVSTSLKEAYLPTTLEPFELWAIYSEWVFYSGTLSQWQELGWPYGDDKVVVNWRPIDPSYVPVRANDITIIGKGTAYGRFLIKKVNNTPAKNMEVEYSINGGIPKKTTTDENGIAYITIENIKESANYEIMFTGTPIQTTKGIMNVIVKPLKFTSEYEAAITRGINFGLGFGVEGSVGELEAEAMLAEVGSSATKEKGISIEQEYDGDKVSLTITSKQNLELAGEAKAGLFAGLNLSKMEGVNISIGEAGFDIKGGPNVFAGYEDSDFDVNDDSDIETMSRVVAAALLEHYSYNMVAGYVLDRIDAPVNVTGKGSSLSVGSGIKLGVFEYGSENSDLSSEAAIASGKGRVVSENSTTTLPDGSIEYKSKSATEAGLTFGEIDFKVKKDKASYKAGFDMFGGKAKNAMSISATRGRGGYLNKLSFATEEVRDNSFLLFDDITTTKYCITYEDAAARAVANDYSVLYNFTNGAKGHFGQEDARKVSNSMVYTGETGTYSIKKEKKHGVDIDLSGSIGLGIKIGGSIGVSGIERYEFEEYSGVYENNAAYIQAYNDIEEDVKNKLITAEQVMNFVQDKISVIFEEYWEVAEKCVEDVTDDIIITGDMVINKSKNKMRGLYVGVTTPKEKRETLSLMALDYDDYYEENYFGKAIGKPYIINVREEDGTQVSDFSETPLILTFMYTDEQLEEAGAYPEALRILYWNDVKKAYEDMKGEVDWENSQISVEITKPGQYILAFDGFEPKISEQFVYYKDDKGVIEAVISDYSGVDEILLYINDEEIINKDNFEAYYDAATGKFRYETDTLEKDTDYGIQLIAKDACGYEGWYDTYMYLESKAYQLMGVTELSPVIGQEETFEVFIDDGLWQVKHVYINMEVSDIYGNTYEETFFCEQVYDGGYASTLPKVNDGSTITVWATVCDRMGGVENSEKKTTVVMDNPKKGIAVSSVSENEIKVAVYESLNLAECKVVLATYSDSGVLESIDILPADSIVTFGKKAESGLYKVYLWNEKGPVCEDAVNAKYDTLF